MKELIFNPPSMKDELQLRRIINMTDYDLSPIIVMQEIPDNKLTITLDAKTYEDVNEKLINI